MNEQEFQSQVIRLRSQWPNSYGKERVGLLWNAFKDDRPDDFKDAVSEILGSHRQAPLIDELSREVDQAKKRRFHSQYRGPGGFKEVLNNAAKANQRADSDFVKLCIKHLGDFQSGKISIEQFFSGCDDIDNLARQLSRMPVVLDNKVSGRDRASGEIDW